MWHPQMTIGAARGDAAVDGGALPGQQQQLAENMQVEEEQPGPSLTSGLLKVT